MKILLLGNGGREHVLAEALVKSPKCAHLICYASRTNPGIKELCSAYEIGDLLDFEHLERFAKKEKPHFAVLGPEDPIALGAADKLEALGIPSVGPKELLARLESSKSFTRDLLKNHGIPGLPKYKTFADLNLVKQYIESELRTDFVVKADSLCGGKGVKVMGDHFSTIDEGLIYAKDCIEGQGKVLIEEKLIGQEFSLMCFADGKTVKDMPAVQDHKRAYDGDKGPNTGGMGSYSYPDILPFLEPKDLEVAHDITVDVMSALENECGEMYQGIMYGGFIVTADGVKLIEYNARFGDPEIMNVLPILQTDFVDICQGIVKQTLDQVDIQFAPQATVCKYLAPEGYPKDPKKGAKIEIGNIPAGVKMYYSAVDQKEDGLYLSSSRAIAFVGIAETVEEAEQLAEEAIQNVDGPVFYRKDIGTERLIQKRVKMMRELRKEL